MAGYGPGGNPASGKRSKFSLSNYKLFSCDGGELVPIGLEEVLPGDTVQQTTKALVRASPLLAPVMHPVHARIHHFFVPHRLVWEDWEKFITGGPDGNDASVFPTITIGGGSGAAVGSLADYLGVPTGVNNIEVSALPFRGYAMIYNEWYRDQDLQTALTIDLTSGADTTTNTTLKNVGWEKDYFTSARPWEVKGDAVTIGIGGEAPILAGTGGAAITTKNVRGIGFEGNVPGLTSTDATAREPGGGTRVYSDSKRVFTGDTTDDGLLIKTDNSNASTAVPQIDVDLTGIVADLSGAGAVNINDLREALSLQRFQEARARYGSRYTEYLAYLGVRSSDARLQRPEYLGGGRETIQFSEVLQTGVTTSGSAEGVGTLRGHGIGALRSNRYRRYFEEHGYIFSFMSIRPRSMYVQGLPRTWNRRVKEDFWQFELQHMGQQEVLNKELYAAHASPDGTFGFQDRYDEYRRRESTIAGEFRSTLDFWHLARIFTSDPTLNASFVECVPTERVFASSATDVFWVMAHHSIQARRKVCQVGTSFTF